MLFILAARVLAKMLSLARDNLYLSPLNLRGNLKYIHSLQFADDTLIFCKANTEEISVLKLILYLFEKASGLSINYAKSSLVYFGTMPLKGHGLASLLDCPPQQLHLKYLGLPLKHGNLNKTEWQPLLDKFDKKKLLCGNAINSLHLSILCSLHCLSIIYLSSNSVCGL